MNANPRLRLWASLSLRQTLFLGAALGIVLPALVLGYFQIGVRLQNEVQQRVRAPLLQYADVLSRGLAVSIWNLDKGVANELVAAVMRNPDVTSVTVTDEYGAVFVRGQIPGTQEGTPLYEEREVTHNGIRVGRVAVQMSSARVLREFRNNWMKLAAALAAQVGISFWFIWLLFDRRMVRPLHELKEGALRLARGELDQPLLWPRRDEIGSLAGGLDKMRQDLRALLSERDQKNAALQHELGQRQRTEVALGFSQAKFAAIFNASPVAMTVSRMGGDFVMQDVNAAWCRLFARDRGAVLGSSGATNGIWKNLADRSAVLDTLVQTGEIAQRQVWMQRGRAQPDVLCEISGKVLSLGAESLLVLTYVDVTAKRQYEEAILALNTGLERRVAERTQELSTALLRLTSTQSELVRAEKMSALGSLVAGVAHELNTPIGNSLMVASTLQDQSASFAANMRQGLTRSRLEEYVVSTQEGAEILMRGLRHAADLVSSFKQVAVDQSSVNRRTFQLRETVDEILRTLGPTIRKTKYVVECDIPSGIAMDSYPGPLGQVITNLINNAFVHAFDGREHGTVRITARAQGDAQVVMVVQDDGVGIPPEAQSRVFDPFFTTKLGRGGSGLGLHIVYNLVQEALGGRIEVSSPPHQGACFTLVLPLVAPQDAAD